MKKILPVLVFAIGIISLTSCSRGYGCPYTTEVKIQKEKTKINDTECITKEIEILETTAFAD